MVEFLQSESFAFFMGTMTDVPVFALLVIPLLGYLIYKRNYRDATLFMLVLGSTLLAILFLKAYYEVPRPDEALISLATFSFPSGHSALIMSLSIMMLYLFSERISSRTLRLTHDMVWLSAVPIIGYSRLALGVHRPEEIVSGYIVGYAVTIAAMLMLYLFWPTPKLKPVSLRKH